MANSSMEVKKQWEKCEEKLKTVNVSSIEKTGLCRTNAQKKNKTMKKKIKNVPWPLGVKMFGRSG